LNRIWQQELDEFVPARLYDMHSHLSRAEFNLAPEAKDADRGWADPAKMLQAARYLRLSTRLT